TDDEANSVTDDDVNGITDDDMTSDEKPGAAD
ncbi:MAG: hypothetical protein QOJ28_3031, partial [Mycobacterium sp.]|nr:hypothetical protein [Mycobacterium sp.]